VHTSPSAAPLAATCRSTSDKMSPSSATSFCISQENPVSHSATAEENGLAVYVRMEGQATACRRCFCSTKVSLASEYCLQVGGRSRMVSETSFCSIAAPGNRFRPLLSWLEVVPHAHEHSWTSDVAAFQRDRSFSDLTTFVYDQFCCTGARKEVLLRFDGECSQHLACWSTFGMEPRCGPRPVRYDGTTSTPVRDCRPTDQAPDAARVTDEQKQKRGYFTGHRPLLARRAAAG
jgi:hypothetical protein